LIGLTVPQIDMAAHAGGFLTGLLLGATLPQREPPMPPSQAVIDVTPTPTQ
jgi:membrane associated rhomboid family serine protease